MADESASPLPRDPMAIGRMCREVIEQAVYCTFDSIPILETLAAAIMANAVATPNVDYCKSVLAVVNEDTHTIQQFVTEFHPSIPDDAINRATGAFSRKVIDLMHDSGIGDDDTVDISMRRCNGHLVASFRITSDGDIILATWSNTPTWQDVTESLAPGVALESFRLDAGEADTLCRDSNDLDIMYGFHGKQSDQGREQPSSPQNGPLGDIHLTSEPRWHSRGRQARRRASEDLARPLWRLADHQLSAAVQKLNDDHGSHPPRRTLLELQRRTIPLDTG